MEEAREFQKNVYFCSLTTLKPLTVWITTNWKVLKEMGIPDHLTCFLRNLGERDNRGWDGWMGLPIQWTWTWAQSEIWWRTGRPVVLQPIGSQRVGDDLAPEQQHPKCFLRNDNIHTRLQSSEGAHRDLKFWLKTRSKFSIKFFFPGI